MHELSIAVNIVEIAEEEAKRAGVGEVLEITLEIGSLSGIVREALEFALGEAKKDSVLQNSEIKITEIKAMAKCSSCGNEFEAREVYDPCTKCANPFSDIISGKDLVVRSIVI